MRPFTHAEQSDEQTCTKFVSLSTRSDELVCRCMLPRNTDTRNKCVKVQHFWHTHIPPPTVHTSCQPSTLAELVFGEELCGMLICASTLANKDKAVNRAIMSQIFVEAPLLK